MIAFNIIALIGVLLLGFFLFVGGGWARLIIDKKGFLHIGWGVIIGFAIIILIACLANFLSFPSKNYAWPTLFFIIFLGIVGWTLRWKYRFIKESSLGYGFCAPLLVFIVYLGFASPLFIKYQQLGSIFYYSGDYMTYWSHAHWLSKHSIQKRPTEGDLITPVSVYAYDYQAKGLRIAAQIWLAFLCSITCLAPDQLITLLSGLMLGLQALIAAMFMFSLRPSRCWTALIVGLLFGLHPFLVWDGYAAFYPQVTGFVFAMAILVIASFDEFLEKPLCTGCILGLLSAALFVSYAEIMPLLGIICTIILSIKILHYKINWHSLVWIIFGCSITFGIFSAIDFSHFWQGLMFQIKTKNAYGGEQSTNIIAILGVLTGAIRAPLDSEVIGQLKQIDVGVIIVTTGSLIVAFIRGHKSLRELQWAAAACFITLALCGIYILHSYQGISLSWNIFKLTNYAVPLIYIWGLLAMFARPNFIIIALYLSAWGFGQVQSWVSVYKNSSYISSYFCDQIKQKEASERQTFINHLPISAGFYVGSLSTYNERFGIYSMLADRNFTTIYDSIPLNIVFCIEPNKVVQSEQIHQLLENQLLVRYVICSPSDAKLYGGKVIYADSSYIIQELVESTILPVSQQYSNGTCETFIITCRPGQKKIPVIFLSSQSQTLSIKLTLSNNANAASIREWQQKLNNPFTKGEIDCAKLQGLQFYMHVHHSGFIEVVNSCALKNQVQPLHFVEQPVDLSKWQEVLPNQGFPVQILHSLSSAKFSALKPSTGWLLLETEVNPGIYYYEIQTGKISINNIQNTTSRPFFFGKESNNYYTLNLTSSDTKAVRWYPFIISEKQKCRFYMGMGAWGAASGEGEIKALKLFEVE